MLLGISAAFDTVDHHLLINQLHRSGVSGNAICWLKSYLSQQTQAVKIYVISQSVGLTCGVPQSVLGPLHFLFIFENVIRHIICFCHR